MGPKMNLAPYAPEIPREAGARDRVILNGGEPTVHRDFFGILKIARRNDAFIDIYIIYKKSRTNTHGI
jgi:uncharacterized radical SAM superfamily Fe-S cluster-containing enzyme